MKINFNCEIEIASRWQKVTFNKWVISIELNGWMIEFKQLIHSGTNLRQVAQRHKTVLKRFGIILCRRNGAKPANMASNP